MVNEETFKFRLFRRQGLFIITKQKIATRYLGAAFKTEGTEVTINVQTLEIEHIDLLGESKKFENEIKKDWTSIVDGTYSGQVLILFRNPLDRFMSAQVQDFTDVLSTVNQDWLTNFVFTSYFTRNYTQDTSFLDTLYKNIESGEFDKSVLNADGTYNIVAYDIFKDMLYDWIKYRHTKNNLNQLHSEHYLYAAKYITEIANKCENISLLNISDPTTSLKNVLNKWCDISKLKNKDRVEGKEILSIFKNLVKENKILKKLIDSHLQNESFCYTLLKNHPKTIKNNITI